MKAIISGATRGIGKAIATKLAEEGYRLVLLARSEEQLLICKKELESTLNSVEIIPVDLSKKSAIEVLKQHIHLFSNVSLLINNLGVYSTQQASKLDLNTLQQQLEINLYSAINLTQFALNPDTKCQLNTIVNIGSIMSLQAMPFAADYSISKHAFKGWNDSLREELRKSNIKVSAIYPGSVNTSSWDGIPADRDQMIQAKDVAEVVSGVLKMSTNTLIEEVRISPRDFTA